MDDVTKERLEHERRKRIRLCRAACLYELFNYSFLEDSEYDKLSMEIDLSLRPSESYKDCCRPEIYERQRKFDDWFETNFDPSTGMWIYSHPELELLKVHSRKWHPRIKIRV